MSERKGLTGNAVKFIAIIAMTIDHLAWTIWPGYDNRSWWLILMHLIGRLTAPTMWFMIAEGYYYTHNLKKYMGRLFIFAVISHFAYNFAFGVPFIPFKTSILNQTGVIWPLFLAVVALYICDDERRSFPLKNWQKVLGVVILCVLAFPSDWSSMPVFCTLFLYANRGNLKKQMLGLMGFISLYVLVWILCVDVVYGIVNYGIILVWPVMYLYNGKRGKWKGMKWFFYLYYVGHLVLIGLLRLYLGGGTTAAIGG